MLQFSVPVRVWLQICAICLAATSLLPASSKHLRDGNEWPAYGGNSFGTRYSPLKQINTQNVAGLQVAWTFDTREGRGDAQTQPIVVGGTMFGITPEHRVIALDAASGKLKWKFDSGFRGRGPNRGVTYWPNGASGRVFAGVQSYLYSLDARTGQPVATFGNAGRIDLREGLGRDATKTSIVLTTPGVIYKDLIIVGGRMPEALPSAPGDIRAFDVRTGKLRWSFHTVPRPGEYGHDTWPGDAYAYTGSANNWCGMVVDASAGMVYVPTGSAASDFYGYDRLGDNLFANTLLALNAATGERIWHFQAVKHDIWDRDFPSPPTLLTVHRNGIKVDAVAQTTKQGVVYLFNRKTGKPLFSIVETAFPKSEIPGEKTADKQPMPSKPAPFARQILTADMLTARTPEAHEWALKRFAALRSDGQFLPLHTEKDTVILPGFDGGAEWGGSALDPETNILYVNANDVAWTSGLTRNVGGQSGKQTYLRNCAVCHGDNLLGAPPQIPALNHISSKKSGDEVAGIIRRGAGRMPAFPMLKNEEVDALAAFLISGEDKKLVADDSSKSHFPAYRFTGYKKFLDPDGYPAVAPPWGTLNAIDLNSGEYVWKIPFGEYPELAAKGLNKTGSENYGGPVVTAGGLVFIGATNFDNKFRAFDKRTGKLLWKADLPASGNATPAVYQTGGREFIVIYATGGKAKEGATAGGIYLAFALPK